MFLKLVFQRLTKQFAPTRRLSTRRTAGWFSSNAIFAAEFLEPRTLLSTVAAIADTLSMSHGGMAISGNSGNVLTNDTILASNLSVTATAVSLTVTTGTFTGNGTLYFQGDPMQPGLGDYQYFPPADVYTGTATFTYTITDTDTGDSSTASVTITLTNDAPIITDANEAQSGIVDWQITSDVGRADPIEFAVEDILAHFSDPDGDAPLELEIDSVLNGTAVFSSSHPGMVEYTPPASGFVGGDPMDEIIMKAKDLGGLRSNSLRFFVRGSGTVNGTGIYLVDRKIDPFLGWHSAIMIVPTDQATWANDPRFGRVIPGTGLRYATLSAHPTSMNQLVIIAGGAKLTSTVNWGDDQWKNLKEITALNLGGIAENDMIQYLFDLDSAFDDAVLQYDPAPAANDNEFNSNSYVHGLLNAAGIDPGVDPAWHPGWEKPLSTTEFDID